MNDSPSQQVVIADRYCGRRKIEAEEGDEERRCLCRLGDVVYRADQRPKVLRRRLERYRRTIVRSVLWHPSWSRLAGSAAPAHSNSTVPPATGDQKKRCAKPKSDANCGFGRSTRLLLVRSDRRVPRIRGGSAVQPGPCSN